MEVGLEGLLVEHNEEHGLIEKTQFALFTDKQDEFIASARKVIDLLSEHADAEEQVLFPLAHKILRMAKAHQVKRNSSRRMRSSASGNGNC